MQRVTNKISPLKIYESTLLKEVRENNIDLILEMIEIFKAKSKTNFFRNTMLLLIKVYLTNYKYIGHKNILLELQQVYLITSS